MTGRTTGAARRVLVVAVALALIVAGGCSNRPKGSLDVPASDALSAAPGLTTITFWHSMDSTNGIALQALIDQFNAAHSGRIKVVGVYQGEYDDAITKYKASVQSNSTPSLMQIYDIGTQFMIDSHQVVPIQGFVDRDHYDLGAIQRNIAGYYTVAGKLWSMPLNSSVPLLYYNKDLFSKAGLDPNRPPRNLAEIRADAQKLSKITGGPAAYGFGAAIYGWYLEQLMATDGQLYCNDQNGRTGQRITSVALDSPELVQTLGWWQGMVEDGLAVNTGRETKAAQNAFTAQQTAMTLESTGVLGSFSAAAKGHFALGAAPFPTVTGTLAPGAGPSIGGASLWISGLGHSDAEKEASWEFVKFLASPGSQAYWHTHTGYFPANNDALELPVEKQYLKANPLFSVAIGSLNATKLKPSTTGCVAGSMPQIRKASEDALEKALIGQPPLTSLQTEKKDVAGVIANYNDSVS